MIRSWAYISPYCWTLSAMGFQESRVRKPLVIRHVETGAGEVGTAAELAIPFRTGEAV